MRFTCLPENVNQIAPEGFVYPLSLDELNRQFSDILSSSHCYLDFITVENTSDVLILRSFWDQAIDLWTMTVVGVPERQAEAVQDSLEKVGLWQAKRWLLFAHEHLHRRHQDWLTESITMRYEQDKLIWEAQESQRPGKRPPPRTSLPRI